MAKSQPEIKTWMVRANLIRRIPQFFQSSLFLFTACLSVWSFLTYPLLAACMAEQWTDKLRNPSVRGSGRQGNWPDTLPSAIHSTFLPQPCPNPTTPPPLPSASPPRPQPLLAPSSEIFHSDHPAPFQILEYQKDVRRCRFDFPSLQV